MAVAGALRSAKARVAYSFVLISVMAGCATVTPDQRARWDETAAICYSKPDCDAKWAAARNWIQGNSGYKIQIYSDDLIETYNSMQYDPKIAVRAVKTPLSVSKNGDESYVIGVKVSCGNIFGCVPSIDESILAFNHSVSAAKSNDANCYTKLMGDGRPRTGFFSQWYKTNKHIVKMVCSGSPAEKAGLAPNDVIINLGGTEIKKHDDFVSAANKMKFGDTVQVEVLRNSEKLKLEMIIPNKEEVAAITNEIKKEKEVVSSPKSVEERLETLTRLHQKGLVSKEEFEEKKKQFLSEM